MRYIAAYALAVLGGNESPTADDIRAIISSVGVEVEDDKLELVMNKLEGKNLEEIQKAGMEHLAVLSTSPAVNTPVTTETKPDETVKQDEKATITDDDDDDEDGIFPNLFD